MQHDVVFFATTAGQRVQPRVWGKGPGEAMTVAFADGHWRTGTTPQRGFGPLSLGLEGQSAVLGLEQDLPHA
jgi:hypothetical protein